MNNAEPAQCQRIYSRLGQPGASDWNAGERSVCLGRDRLFPGVTEAGWRVYAPG